MDMGTQNKRYGTIGDLNELEHVRLALQVEIDGMKDIEERRRFGQFSTPYELAEEIVSFLHIFLAHFIYAASSSTPVALFI